MLGSLRLTRLRAAGAFFIAVLALIPVLLSGGTAHATPYGEIQVGYDGSYCITALHPDNPGSELVIGYCADADSQLFNVDVLNGNYVELFNTWGLCVTFDMANFGPDGAYALLGYCEGAQNQIFEAKPGGYGGGSAWYMPYRVDYLGRHVALDNEGNNLVPYNHIDESYYSSALPSESWFGPL
jgi:hypothetical protein